MIEHPLFIAFGKKCQVTDLDRERSLNSIDKADQLSQTRWPEAGGQLQPQGSDPLAQRCEQLDEVLSGMQLLTQVAAVADVAMKFGGEAKGFRQALRPALNNDRRGPRIKRGIAFNGVEHLRVQSQKIVGPGTFGVQRLTPGVFTPGRATEVIRKWVRIQT